VTPEDVRARWPYLTDARAAAVLLYNAGSASRIGRVLGIAKAAVRDRLNGAELKIARHQHREDG
jgi:hypothetical protein